MTHAPDLSVPVNFIVGTIARPSSAHLAAQNCAVRGTQEFEEQRAERAEQRPLVGTHSASARDATEEQNARVL